MFTLKVDYSDCTVNPKPYQRERKNIRIFIKKTQTMEITQQQINAAYRAATIPEIKQVLDALFGTEANQNACQPTKDNRPVTERIKTFEDARRALGDSNPLVFQYDELTHTNQEVEKMGSATDIVAYLKLRIIVAALNEGWKPKYEDGEYRWAPWYRLYTKAEMENELDEEERRSCRVVGRSYYGAYARGGLACAVAYHDSSVSSTGSGSRLAFKSEELAEYAGKQFIDIYAQMMGLEIIDTPQAE